MQKKVRGKSHQASPLSLPLCLFLYSSLMFPLLVALFAQKNSLDFSKVATLQLCSFAALQLCNFATLQLCNFATLSPCSLPSVSLPSSSTGHEGSRTPPRAGRARKVSKVRVTLTQLRSWAHSFPQKQHPLTKQGLSLPNHGASRCGTPGAVGV